MQLNVADDRAARGHPGLPLGSVAFILRTVVALVFLYASAWKIRHPYEFLDSIYNYEIVGRYVGLALARIIPWFELV